MIKSGYSVKLKFKLSNTDLASGLKRGHSNAMTLTGTILNIDRDSMTGTLRQKRTNKIVNSVMPMN